MITFRHSGDFKNAEKFFRKIPNADYLSIFHRYGQEGVTALSSATPKDSGETASSWNYKIKRNKNGISITWTNSHVVDGINIAVILQYGHGTRTGGYVQGIDYINPSIKPIFNNILENIWKEVTAL